MNESKKENINQPKADSAMKVGDSIGNSKNPMKNIITKKLPTKIVFFDEHEKKK